MARSMYPQSRLLPYTLSGRRGCCGATCTEALPSAEQRRTARTFQRGPKPNPPYGLTAPSGRESSPEGEL
jgi:hypothetical protein